MKLSLSLWASGYVKRWHSHPVRALRESGDTTGAHSHRMAMLLLMLHPTQPSAHLLSCILTHDTAEMYTGDAPAPVKDTFLGKAYAKTEEIFSRNLGLPIPSQSDQKWVMLCDKLDAYLWMRDIASAVCVTQPVLEMLADIRVLAEDLGVLDSVARLVGGEEQEAPPNVRHN